MLLLATLLLPTLCLSAALNGDGPARWQQTTISCVTKPDKNNSSVTCLFGFDVAQKKYDFNVITIDPASNKQDVVLMCNWIIEGQPPECKIDEGYTFDNTNINDKTSLFVPPQILDRYKFQCQILPPDPNRPSQPCDKNTTCKEGVHINDTTTTESTTVPSTTTQTATTAKPETIDETSGSLSRIEIIIISSVIGGVAVLVVAIAVGVVFLYRKLRYENDVEDYSNFYDLRPPPLYNFLDAMDMHVLHGDFIDDFGKVEEDQKTSKNRTNTLSSSPSQSGDEDENQSDNDSMHTASENGSLLEIEPPNDNGGQKPT